MFQSPWSTSIRRSGGDSGEIGVRSGSVQGGAASITTLQPLPRSTRRSGDASFK